MTEKTTRKQRLPGISFPPLLSTVQACTVYMTILKQVDGVHVDLYSSPMWIKVYHALLEWQSLYHDVCGLNSMLLSPFLELPPSSILDGSFVIETALNLALISL